MVMAWIFLILSFCRESWIVLRWWAAGIFVTGFVAAVLELPVLWEVCRETKNFLWQSHYFEVDEQIQLKKLLNRLRWSRLGVIWVAPLFFLRRLGRPSSD
jgi:hypothetical protein